MRTIRTATTITVQLLIVFVVLTVCLTRALTVVLLMVIESADRETTPAEVELPTPQTVTAYEGMRWNELRAYAKSRGCPSSHKTKASIHDYLLNY